MIRINLLKQFSSNNVNLDAFTVNSERDQVIKDAAKRVIVLLIGPLALYVYETQAIPVLKQKLATTSATLSETQQFIESKKGLADEIKKYEEEQNRFNAQMGFINKISKDKVNEFKLFQHLRSSTPESVWINKLVFKDNELLIKAESDVPADLSKFLDRLGNTEFLTGISPLTQDIKLDPFGIGVQTTTLDLKAQFNNGGSSQ